MNQEKGFLVRFAELLESSLRSVRKPHDGRWTSIVRWLMPNGGTILIALLLIFTQSVWARNLTSSANAPGASATTVNYQGRLADSGGVPITQNDVPITFTIFDAAQGGNPLWSELRVVNVANGLFNVGLGAQTAGGIPTNTWNGDRYLEIKVGSETLSPRELIRSVPVAGMALTVPNGSIGTGQIANGAVTQSKLGEQPYYFTGALATPTEWMADVVFNGNYTRFCQAIGRTFSRADELQSHYTDTPGLGQGNGHFYNGWYYVGIRIDSADTHTYGNGNPTDAYNVWKYNGGAAISRAMWTYERSAIIWCK